MESLTGMATVTKGGWVLLTVNLMLNNFFFSYFDYQTAYKNWFNETIYMQNHFHSSLLPATETLTAENSVLTCLRKPGLLLSQGRV